MRFRDRVDAGRQLAAELEIHRAEAPLVLGLPRGGVPVAYEVAAALGAPLDLWVVRKVGAPFEPELGLGAVAEGGELVVNQEALAILGISEQEVERLAAPEAEEVERRVRRFRGGRPAPEIRGRTVIVVDDGIATGGTMEAALRAVRRRGPKRLVLAVPVAASDTLERLRPEVDEVVCLESSRYLTAIGFWYEDFQQTTDEEVLELLRRSREAAGGAPPSTFSRQHYRELSADETEARERGWESVGSPVEGPSLREAEQEAESAPPPPSAEHVEPAHHMHAEPAHLEHFEPSRRRRPAGC